ncbi:MAG: hypothetical protein U0T82_17270 [Bacteroidales bacterium]
MLVFLNALTGRGVHIVTVNDYLAKRDSEWMGLCMSSMDSPSIASTNISPPDERRNAYLADITFGTNNEFGFGLSPRQYGASVSDLVQRQHIFHAIVDEVDSVLIDDARTPLDYLWSCSQRKTSNSTF